MPKDFDKWNKQKQALHAHTGDAFAHPREIWWCALGANIGAETDGKNESLERPILVMRVYNRDTLLILPLISRKQDDKFHFKITRGEVITFAKLTQSRVISGKRLLRKICTVPKNQFDDLHRALIVLL